MPPFKDRGFPVSARPLAQLAVFFFLLILIFPGTSRGEISEGFDGFQTGTRPAGWEFNGCDQNGDTCTGS